MCAERECFTSLSAECWEGHHHVRNQDGDEQRMHQDVRK